MNKISAIVFVAALSLTGLIRSANAADAFLSVTPGSATRTSGETFNISVAVNSSTAKVDAVEGTIILNNLSCRGITLANGIMPVTMPTCSNRNFLLGIGGGATGASSLFNISVSPTNAGTASISFTGVDILSEGKSVSSASNGGTYTINAGAIVPKITPGTPAAGTGTTSTTTASDLTSTSTQTAAAGESLSGFFSNWTNWIWLIIGLAIGIIGTVLFNGYKTGRNH